MTVTDLIPDTERIVFLSIRPEHCWAILDGRKQYEFRRTPPAIDPPYTALLYATADAGELRGLIHVPDQIQDSPTSVAMATQADVPQDPEDIRDYLDGGRNPTALQIGAKAEFDPPIPHTEIAGLWEPAFTPQNFRYVDSPALLEEARSRVVKYVGGTTRRCESFHTDPHCYRLNRKGRDPHVPTESEIQFHDIEHCPNCNPTTSEDDQSPNSGAAPPKVANVPD